MVLDIEKPTKTKGIILEAWAQGFMVGGLAVMACITVANMRRRVALHKLILIELLLGSLHGTFIFTDPPVYHWYLSMTGVMLNVSWSLHNVIGWVKNKSFLPRWGSNLYISTLILVQPYWVLEIVASFLYFSGRNRLFIYTRPYETLFRDPWWVFTICSLLYNIKIRYGFGYVELMRVSPRFAVLLGAMTLSAVFVLLDVLAVTNVVQRPDLPNGVNPFWKLAFVFKCLTDIVILDDFKTALDQLTQLRLQRFSTAARVDLYARVKDIEQGHRREMVNLDLDISRPAEFVQQSVLSRSDLGHAPQSHR